MGSSQSGNNDNFESDLKRAIELSLEESKKQTNTTTELHKIINETSISGNTIERKNSSGTKFHDYPSSSFASYKSKIAPYQAPTTKVPIDIESNLHTSSCYNFVVIIFRPISTTIFR